jgi:hypothetical protein
MQLNLTWVIGNNRIRIDLVKFIPRFVIPMTFVLGVIVGKIV